MSTPSLLDVFNLTIARSGFGRYFCLEGSGARRERAGSRFTTELRAGITTFVTMAYIISVNAKIVVETGGPCDCKAEDCNSDPEYNACLAVLHLDLITATIAISGLSSLLLGVFSNLPICLAPGMGLNVYFTYMTVGTHGSGKISYETALTAVFMEGVIFLALSVSGIRQWFARLIPKSIKIATGAGIGLFLTFIGMQSSAGIGLIGSDKDTIVALTGCIQDATGACIPGTHMRNPTTWMGILGFVIISVCLLFRVKGAVLLGMIFISVLSWIRGTPFTYFPYTPGGNERFDYFKKIVSFHPIQSILWKMDFQLHGSEVWIALMTFLYVDLLDTTATMYSMARFSGYMYRNGDFEGSSMAFICDAASIILGACFGLPPVTAFIESGAGIVDGGCTGITAMMTAFLFFISLFFTPIFASFPEWATGPALIVIGGMMAKSVRSINWNYIGDAIPAFLTIALMPLTYSIAYGLIAGIGSYTVINGSAYLIQVLSGGRLVPADRDFREPWGEDAFTLASVLPPWLQWLICKMTGRMYVDPLDVIEEEERLEREEAALTATKKQHESIQMQEMETDSNYTLAHTRHLSFPHSYDLGRYYH
ncbi:hypothetical protein BGZ68_001925 [Mortierella alpina]|nr:hypothetical protein BGZ68_001925 [Mortierella alpina]